MPSGMTYLGLNVEGGGGGGGNICKQTDIEFSLRMS
jgi:hypothetical protein